MRTKNKLATILTLFLASALLIVTTCSDEDDEPTNNPPTCIISSPENNAEFEKGTIVTIVVEAFDEDNELDIIRLYINGISIGSASHSPFTYDWDTSEEELGSFTITAEAINEEQEKTSDEINIIIIRETVTDIDGNKYPIIQIGEQVWMAENLKTQTYKDGIPIELVENDTDWEYCTTGAYCWFDNNESQYADIYGAMYNWYAVNTSKLCPDGWHVPSDAEWTILEEYIASDGHSESVGAALKATYGWHNNGNGTDDYGFTALPGGDRLDSGGFILNERNGYWWSSTADTTFSAWYRGLHDYSGNVYRYCFYKSEGISVRCLKD